MPSSRIVSCFGKPRQSTDSKVESNDKLSSSNFMAPRTSLYEKNNGDFESLKLEDFSFKKKRMTGNNDGDSKVSSLLMKKTTSQGISPGYQKDENLIGNNDDSIQDNSPCIN